MRDIEGHTGRDIRTETTARCLPCMLSEARPYTNINVQVAWLLMPSHIKMMTSQCLLLGELNCTKCGGAGSPRGTGIVRGGDTLLLLGAWSAN